MLFAGQTKSETENHTKHT